jgi:hypothetical protein
MACTLQDLSQIAPFSMMLVRHVNGWKSKLVFVQSIVDIEVED